MIRIWTNHSIWEIRVKGRALILWISSSSRWPQLWQILNQIQPRNWKVQASQDLFLPLPRKFPSRLLHLLKLNLRKRWRRQLHLLKSLQKPNLNLKRRKESLLSFPQKTQQTRSKLTHLFETISHSPTTKVLKELWNRTKLLFKICLNRI